MPIQHKIGNDHTGRRLKEKLYKAYFGVKDANKDGTQDNSAGADNKAEGETPSGTCPLA